LEGVSITTNGTALGVTGSDGRFQIATPAGTVIAFSINGYATQTTTVTQNDDNAVITLDPTATGISEVVVTALGIRREEKSLGYSVAKVDNEDLTNTVSNNWLNSMQGKVAGLVLDRANTGPGGSMRMTLRGDQSLNYGSNEALLVIDGVPVSSGTTATASGTNYANADAPVDFGNAASELNPEDIESVSVLKGPSATALYGSRAANGAIVITTKSGRTDKGIGITVNSSATFENA